MNNQKLTEDQARSLAEKASMNKDVQATVAPARGGGYCVVLNNTRLRKTARAHSESEVGMLLLAWG